MFLSRVELDIENRNTTKAMNNLSMLHGAVESAFRGGRERRLWRIDCVGEHVYLLIASRDKPDLDSISGQFGYKGRPGETIDYESFINSIKEGSRWRFRLVANPTYSKAQEPGARGKVHSHVSVAQIEGWLRKRSVSCGFSVAGDELAVTQSLWYDFKKTESETGKKSDVRFKAAAFEGVLKVTDAAAFQRTLREGIGREKAYGMGMLTVIPA